MLRDRVFSRKSGHHIKQRQRVTSPEITEVVEVSFTRGATKRCKGLVMKKRFDSRFGLV